MVRENVGPMYYLAPGQVTNLLVRKKGSPEFRPLHMETVEISPTACCFEWEGKQEFQAREDLEFLFHLEDRSLNVKGTIVSIDPWKSWDEGYEYKTWHAYRAQFEAELDAGLFQRLAGDPKKSGV